MRNCIILVIVALTLTVSLQAQENRKKELYAGGGVSFPTTPLRLTDNCTAGFNLSGGIGWYIVPTVSLITSLELNHFSLNSNASTPEGTTITLALFESMKYSFEQSSTESPYLLAGLGYYHLSTSYHNNYNYNESTFGMQAGVGLDIPIDEKTAFFLEIKYVLGVTDHDATGYIPLRGGFKIGL